MASPSTITITVDGVDITNKVLFSSASFEAQLNAQPGTCQFTVKDLDQTMSFTTGDEILLSLDGQLLWGGYVMQVTRKYALPADDTTVPASVQTRQFVIHGSDYNVLFDKRVVRNPNNYLQLLPDWTASTQDGALIREALGSSKYIDVPAGFDVTTEVDDVDLRAPGAWVQQGTPWRRLMEDFAQFTGAVWYISADKKVHYHALEDVEARWGFSDVPNKSAITASPVEYQGATYGFRELDATEDGSHIINDALVWGGSEWAGNGETVFAREQNTTSQTTHGRWQLAETHFGEENYLIQDGVDIRAEVIVNGFPGTVAGDPNRGLRFPQWQFRFSWFGKDVPEIAGVKDHLQPGDLVVIDLQVMGLTGGNALILPLRQVRMTFPTLTDGDPHVRFDGFFGLELSDPWTLWRYLLKRAPARNQFIVATADGINDAVYGSVYNGPFTADPDGTTVIFDLPASYAYIAGTTEVYKSGFLQRRGTEYTESSPTNGQVTFTSAPAGTDWIWIICRIA